VKAQRLNRRTAVASLAVAAALLLAACSSGSTAASGSGSGSGSSSSTYTAMLNTARQMVPATFQGPTKPAKAPAGIKIASITCYSILEGCVIPADGVAKAAQAIGWQARTFDGGGTATTQNTQILNAVSWGAKVIVLVAITPSAVQSGLQAAKNAGALIVSGSSALSTPNATIAPQPGQIWPAFDVSPDYKNLGQHLAQWIIADSQGKANVGVYGDKEFDSINAQESGIVPALQACTTCKSSAVKYFSATQIANQLGPQTVSYVRSNPDVTYIYSAFDPPAAAQVQALQTAGLGRNIKIVSALGNAQNLQFIKNGQVEAADAAYDNNYMGFAIVDQSIRLLNKQPLIQPLGEGLPFQVLDKSNLPSNLNSWTAPYDYESKFIALWK
ncbi:MAG: ribose transport system substrate-binding protein, partial [Pseudonocardiales bacterium]|jgi:ribose transport system substrate-binding protein|nr:ribose transport system substrate-binding protein [Pseudonocardiales bacterium]